MKRICPSCLMVSDSKSNSIKGSLLGGAVLIGGGILLSRNTLYNDQLIFILMGLAFVLAGAISIRNYYRKVSKVCPKCKYDNMPLIYEPEGQKILNDHGMMVKDDSTHICSKCHHRCDYEVQSMKWSIALIIAGIFMIPLALLNPIGIIGPLLIIGTGIYGVYTNYRKSIKCPECKNTSLIPIDSDQAKELIKQTQ